MERGGEGEGREVGRGKGREGEYIMLFQDDIQHENIAIVKNCAFIFQLVYILSPHLPED